MHRKLSIEAQAVRLLAITEGLSLLILFFVAMPAKHVFDRPFLVTLVGPVHDGLFLLYIAAMVMWRSELRWTWTHVLIASLAASVPFASFFPWFHSPAAEALPASSGSQQNPQTAARVK